MIPQGSLGRFIYLFFYLLKQNSPVKELCIFQEPRSSSSDSVVSSHAKEDK